MPTWRKDTMSFQNLQVAFVLGPNSVWVAWYERSDYIRLLCPSVVGVDNGGQVDIGEQGFFFFCISPNTSIPLPGYISYRPVLVSPYMNFVKML